MPPHPAETRVPVMFASAFGHAAQASAAAPGRVNLIGEHTDYNDGFVLPMAIDRETVCAGRLTDDGRVTLISASTSDPATFLLGGGVVERGFPHWTNYVRGVIAGFQRRGIHVPGLNLAIDSDVPLGGGLSSSASLEVAVATVLETLTGHHLDFAERIDLCREAEHEFAGVPCGVMDQSIVVMACDGHALLLDCRSSAVQHVPFSDPSVCVLVVNTAVRHSLASGEYARRRHECAVATRQLGVASLRDATIDMLEDAGAALDPRAARRAHHVITENARTLDAAAALKSSDWSGMGRLMYESHASLRDDFEVSCAELDAVVDIAHAIGESGGVWGCRMTGGGFGGCAVCLVRADAVAEISGRIATEYEGLTRRVATIFPTRPARGARVLTVCDDE